KGKILAFGHAGNELTLDSDNASVVLHGYCSYNTNPLGISKAGSEGVNPLNVQTVVKRMRHHDAAGRLNIVSIHSGQEHVNYPSRDDMRMARLFAGVAPYVYYGHHPHVVQGIEML